MELHFHIDFVLSGLDIHFIVCVGVRELKNHDMNNTLSKSIQSIAIAKIMDG